MKQKNRTRLLAGAAVILISLLIFHKSLVRLFIPNVRVLHVSSGTLQMVYRGDSLSIDESCLETVISDIKTVTAIPSFTLLKKAGENIQPGDRLAVYDQAACEENYIAAKKMYINKRLELDEFDKGYSEALKNARKDVREAEEKLGLIAFAPEEKKRDTEKAYRDALQSLERLEKDKIHNGTTEDILVYECETAKQQLQEWEILKTGNYELVAQNQGTLISFSPSLPYSYVYLPADREVTMRLDLSGDLSGIYSIGSSGQLSSSLSPDWQQSIRVSGIVHAQDQVFYTFSFRPSDLSFLGSIDKMTLNMTTAYYPILVSPQAFVTDTDLWVAQPTYRGSRTIYTAHRVTVERMPGNTYFVPCIGGLTEDSLVITDWDRPLSEGAAVYIAEP